MLRSTLVAAVVSLATFSVASALPSLAPTPLQSNSVVQVGYKGHHNKGHYSKHGNWNKHHTYNNWNHHRHYGQYHYGGRYWGHRYNYRPYGWATLGCIVVGPVWYCP